MKQTLTFIPPVVDSTQSSIHTEAYEKSVDLYNQGEYLQAFHSLLDYLNADFRTKYGNTDGTEFHIPHGSILVHISVKDGFYRISADFLNLPEKGRVAMLRQIADLNLNKLLLPRFVKDNDKLRMEYTCSLSQSHPHKMYFVLQNICHIGDKYDDEFCTKFGATRCYEPQVTSYPQEEIDRIYEGLQILGRETLEAVKEYDVDRKYGYSWNVLDTTFYQISYFAFLEKLLVMTKEELAADLYFVDTLVSTKRRSSLKNMQENFMSVYKEATEAIQTENYERSVVRLLYIFYEAYFYNDVQDDINIILSHALKKASGKPMEDASEILYNAMDKIMEGDLEPDEDDLEEISTEAIEQIQGMAASLQEEIMKAQADMQSAMMKGDMTEYMRLAQELQQKMIQQALGGQQ